MTPELQQAIAVHAERDFPREACGLIIDAGRGRAEVIACRNIAEKPETFFVLDPRDYAEAESRGRIVALYHSHPNGSAVPSEADRSACEASGLPWYVVGWPAFGIARIEPCGYEAPLYGRPFAWRVHDCYQFLRDWYRRERAIALPDYEYEWEWWLKGKDYYRQYFSACGFVEVKPVELAPGDAVLMMIRAPVENHAAIYLGDNLIAHHALGRLSCREVWGGYWMNVATGYLRHAG